MSTDPVAAIAETSATGEIADIYSDIRRTLGVEVVNLVWRHLATIDGALPWAWQAVRPAYISGVVGAEAERMKDALRPPHLIQVPADVLSAAGLGVDDLARIEIILTSYDRSNAMNFLALSALVHGGGGTDLASGSGAPVSGSGTSESVGEMPPLPPLNEMSSDMTALLRRLNALGEADEDWIMVSMYRHLSYWPGYLAIVWSLLAPLAADGRLQAAVKAVEATAAEHAKELSRSFAKASIHAEGQQVLQAFLDRVRLPKMILVTRLLLDAMTPRQ